jgi:hypothetical protein
VVDDVETSKISPEELDFHDDNLEVPNDEVTPDEEEVDE